MNKKRREVTKLEEERGVTIEIHADSNAMPEHIRIVCTDADSREIKVDGLDTL